jgi:hypothetical protein
MMLPETAPLAADLSNSPKISCAICRCDGFSGGGRLALADTIGFAQLEATCLGFEQRPPKSDADAAVPFQASDADGAQLSLLRVEIDTIADVGSITPHLGGTSFRYDPLPIRMVSRRKRIRLVYFDGRGLRPFDLAEAMRLAV